jgi:RecB family exonuclease
MRLSFTRLAEWRRCRQRYAWHYVDNIERPSAAAQIRGKAGHAALAAYYSGAPVDQAILAGLVELEEIGEGVGEERALMKAILARYFQYAKVVDNWTVVAVEQELKGNIGGYEMIGYVDLIVRKHGSTKLSIVDHKFQRDASIEDVLLSPQLAMYEELVRQNYGEDSLEDLIYNVVRTILGGQAALKPVHRVRAQIRPSRRALWKDELIAQADEMWRFHTGEAGGPRVYRNQTKNCSWDCAYYQRCLVLDSLDTSEVITETRSQESESNESGGGRS